MIDHARTWLRHQQSRWLRPDAYRWVRPDARRFISPGGDLAEAFPALAHKYNPDQPRVPAGSPDGGQWTDGSGGAAKPMGDLGFGDLGFGNLAGLEDFGALFQITPSETDLDGVQLAGDPPIGDSPQTPSSEPPEIPPERPNTSVRTTSYLRAAANWLAQNAGLAADIYAGAMNNVEWLKDYGDVVQAARDEPKSFEELQEGVSQRRPGYDDHHIVEQTWAERFGYTRSEIDDPSNLVSIPRLKHYQITGWYGTSNPDFNDLSPREYLRDKSWEERRQVGLDALVLFKVLKP